MMRTQDEIVADLRRRADVLLASAANMGLKHTVRDRLTLARVLMVAAEQNSFEHQEPAERGNPSPWYAEG